MSDSQKDTRQLKQAVTYPEGKAHFELTAEELIFPIIHQEYKIYCRMKPYEAYAVKRFYDLIIPRRKRLNATESALQSVDLEELYDFISDHFLGMDGATLPDGSEPSLEQLKIWLDENRPIKLRIFSDGYVGPRLQPEKISGKVILLFGVQEHRIQDQTRLFSRERKSDELITVTHVLTKLSKSEKHQYETARKIIEDSRHGETYQQANWDVIEQLYNHHARALEGALYDGRPCTAENRGDNKNPGWIARVPFLMKATAMTQISEEVDLKNA
jgi:hypothetical protein